MKTHDLNIERALLSSYILDNTKQTIEKGYRPKLDETMFYLPFHVLVAKCINWLLEKEMEFNELLIMHYISKNNNIGVNQENEMLNILVQSPFHNVLPLIDILQSYKIKREILEDDI